MNRYYTFMLIPERTKEVWSLRIPHLIFKSLSALVAAVLIMLAILCYDYYHILNQVYETKRLSIENQELKEQLQLFQLKMNTLNQDLNRINTFEKKIRSIMGIQSPPESNNNTLLPFTEGPQTPLDTSFYNGLNPKDSFFLERKAYYEEKIAKRLGLKTGYRYTKNWNEQIRKSFSLAEDYSAFDYTYARIKDFTKSLELSIHSLDQDILGRESFLKATPSLLPAQGWITSFFGLRNSPESGRTKMHEGLDIGAPPGSKILAPADGIVNFAGVKHGFGRFVSLDHGYGMETLYAHADRLSVKAGDTIKRGMLLGTVGSTGSSTGPHLHYEVRVNGIPVDPLYFILD